MDESTSPPLSAEAYVCRLRKRGPPEIGASSKFLRNPKRVTEIGEVQEVWTLLSPHMCESVARRHGLIITVVFQIDAVGVCPVPWSKELSEHSHGSGS